MKNSQTKAQAKVKHWLDQNRDAVNAQVRLLQRNGVKPPYQLRVCIDGHHLEVELTNSID